MLEPAASLGSTGTIGHVGLGGLSVVLAGGLFFSIRWIAPAW